MYVSVDKLLTRKYVKYAAPAPVELLIYEINLGLRLSVESAASMPSALLANSKTQRLLSTLCPPNSPLLNSFHKVMRNEFVYH